MSRRARCTSCGTTEQVTRARDFPAVEVCTSCQSAFLTWLVRHRLADNNPLTLQFWAGPTIWVESPDGGFRGHAVQGFELVVKQKD